MILRVVALQVEDVASGNMDKARKGYGNLLKDKTWGVVAETFPTELSLGHYIGFLKSYHDK
jgi:hypothetical protein